MKTLSEIKQAIVNPPPGRLEKIEYQSHFLQILGVTVVCAFLIWKGFWYIIFAFIFSVGVSYSQGINAYKRYRIINQHKEPYDVKLDKSPTRRRDFVIKNVFGKYVWIVAGLISVIITQLVIPSDRWFMKVAFTMIILFNYLVIYFVFFHFIAKIIYDKRDKNNKQRGKKQ